MTAAQWSSHPPGKWCAAEIIAHLSLTYSNTAAALQTVLAGGKPTATTPKLKQRIKVFILIEIGYFPKGVEAPKIVRPTGIQDGTILNEALGHLAAMDAALNECEQRFGPSTPLIDHPVLGALNVTQWRKFHAIHARHHAPQIAGLRCIN